ncbi:hypothetical protein DLP05_124 [Stenotrophomonas phage vB_SmaS_DLP_5]|uniref:Uncharacterized protein n=1 Tax=Stenotrophomonas phage vB_SmaS_DLP_5 TaxID=2044561 RepID=A0A2D2W2N7_9CAUD|nr:hypothetical protein FDJ07_gp097 [Stenotrophomonas phage vB_SmaS_DLP_5]ATS92404.1 hypothetical protein DLP05_124 [Stenotrophomonas phage vB_SmaS_DLP_5]
MMARRTHYDLVEEIQEQLYRMHDREVERFAAVGELVERGIDLSDDDEEFLENLADRLGI